ncbi:putative transcription factor interactor and regulator LIM family [Helianthus annuus]|nr:putative transcription factor interactor and regulator LIM family [Helianthus annuus]KAJ0642066.1 putative transcription factor interactor and regulator LIM family [Helianthus annuus]KAJ0682691.1 putative transcription factor interactor and regulator LIM family [Helianthus annuus]
MSFTGTLDKCKACDKTVYFVDLLSVDGTTYHKACFKCSHCKGTLAVCFLYLLQIFLLSRYFDRFH